MTATIIAFPTLYDRDQMEFYRTGYSNLTRAFDEAHSLFAALTSASRPAGFGRRVAAFRRAVEHLGSYRPEALDDFAHLGGTYEISLRDFSAQVAKLAVA